jgi:hypothetical protein
LIFELNHEQNIELYPKGTVIHTPPYIYHIIEYPIDDPAGGEREGEDS